MSLLTLNDRVPEGARRWKENTKRSTLVWFAFDRDYTAVLVDDATSNRKTESAASLFRGEKRTEEPAHILPRNANAGILDENSKLAW